MRKTKLIQCCSLASSRPRGEGENNGVILQRLQKKDMLSSRFFSAGDTGRLDFSGDNQISSYRWWACGRCLCRTDISGPLADAFTAGFAEHERTQSVGPHGRLRRQLSASGRCGRGDCLWVLMERARSGAAVSDHRADRSNSVSVQARGPATRYELRDIAVLFDCLVFPRLRRRAEYTCLYSRREPHAKLVPVPMACRGCNLESSSSRLPVFGQSTFDFDVHGVFATRNLFNSWPRCWNDETCS